MHMLFNKKQKNVHVYSSKGKHGKQFYVTVCSGFVFFSAVLFLLLCPFSKKYGLLPCILGLKLPE